MTDKTENRSYNVPAEGEEDWHEPVNENWESIDKDVQELYDNLNGTGGKTGDVEALAVHDVYVYELGDSYEAVNSDGTTIDSGDNGMNVLQSGVDASPGGGTIYVHGNYTFAAESDKISIGDNKRLVGYSSIFKNRHDDRDAVFELAGGTTGVSTSLVQDAENGANHIYVADASAFQQGDLIRIFNDQYYSGNREAIQGETHLVWDVDAANDLIITSEGVYFDHETSENAYAERIVPDVGHVEGITIEGSGEDAYQRGIEANYAKNCIIESVKLSEMGEKIIDLDTCYGCEVRDSILERSNVPGDGYGIRVRNGCANTIIKNNQIRLCRHGVAHSVQTSEGLARQTYITGNLLTPTQEGSPLDAHDGTISWFIQGNQLYGNDGASVINGAKETYIIGNSHTGVRDRREDDGGFYRTRGDNTWDDGVLCIRGNVVRYPGGRGTFHIREPSDSNFGSWKVVDISDNNVIEPKEYVVRMGHDTDSLIFNGNTIENKTHGEGDQVFYLVDGLTIRSGSISNNTFNRMARRLIRTDHDSISNLSVRGNTFYASPQDDTTSILNIPRASGCVVADNDFYNPDGGPDRAIWIRDTSTDILVRGNNVYHDGGTTPIDDEGTATVLDGNYEHDGGGWSSL